MTVGKSLYKLSPASANNQPNAINYLKVSLCRMRESPTYNAGIYCIVIILFD